MTMESPGGRSLSDFTVELDVYSGPYEWLLALILKDELEIFEVPLRELVALYLRSRNPDSPNSLERDTDFAGSASALVLLKSRTLSPALDTDSEGGDEVVLSPEELAERLSEYLKIRRGADSLRERFLSNAGHHPSAHTLPPRPGRLQIDPLRLSRSSRR
jgi:segregation and condensation protein A